MQEAGQQLTKDMRQAQQQAVTKAPDPVDTFISRYGEQIGRALPKHIGQERMIRILVTYMRNSPKLVEIATGTPQQKLSLLSAMLSCAQHGLEPGVLGHAWIIPRRRKGIWEANFQIGWKGLKDLAYRSGQIDYLDGHVVFEGDEFRYEYGAQPVLVHKPSTGDRKKATHWYVVCKVKGSDSVLFRVYTKADAQAAKARSDASESASSPWNNPAHFDKMVLKSALMDLGSFMPLSVEHARVDGAENDPTYARTMDIDSGSAAPLYDLQAEAAKEEVRGEAEVVPEPPEQSEGPPTPEPPAATPEPSKPTKPRGITRNQATEIDGQLSRLGMDRETTLLSFFRSDQSQDVRCSFMELSQGEAGRFHRWLKKRKVADFLKPVDEPEQEQPVGDSEIPESFRVPCEILEWDAERLQEFVEDEYPGTGIDKLDAEQQNDIAVALKQIIDQRNAADPPEDEDQSGE